jgi:hypothetical protein
LNTHIGRPVADLDDFLEAEVPATPLRVAPEQTPGIGSPRRAHWWIVAGIASIAAALGAWVFFSPASPIAPASAPQPTLSHTGVAGFAEMYVAKYLSGEPEVIDEFLPAAPSLAAMAPAEHYATRTAATDITAVAPGYWSVQVAADVLVLDGPGYVPAGLQHFRIGVVDDGGRLVAAGLPARVAAPPPRRAPPRSLATADSPPSETVAALAGDFLEALLLGGRDLSRYIAAGSPIAPVAPHYAELTITSLATYGDGSVHAVVDARSANGSTVTMEYNLAIEHNSGGPQVLAILPGPPSIHVTDAAR